MKLVKAKLENDELNILFEKISYRTGV
jgi:hypothetical protein